MSNPKFFPMVVVAAVILALLAPCAGADDPPQPSSGELIAKRFQGLNAGTAWRRVGEIEMKFDTYHPQGMAVIGERIYVSSVEVIDRREGRGVGHLFETNMQGELLRRIQLGEGAMYHPGGMDFDGERLWIPVAEYRPGSRSVVYTVDPKTMSAHRIFEFADHLGAILRDAKANTLIAHSWGSRRFYRWEMKSTEEGWKPLDPGQPVARSNRSHFVDYQDGQWLPGTHFMLCGGLKGYRVPGRRDGSFALGGVALIDTRSFEILHEVPVPLWVGGRIPMTQNPMYVEATEEGLRFYFMPDDNRSTVYVYEPGID